MTPFKGRNRVTSPYGWRTLSGKREFHYGIDIVGDDDLRCRAIWDAIRAETSLGWNAGRGNLVRLYYSNSLRVLYQHLQLANIYTGKSRVSQGDYIGLMGNTGNSTGAHLHLEVQLLRNGKWTPVEPSAYAEVPNRAGSHAGNDRRDAKNTAPTAGLQTENAGLYGLSVGPASAGDKNTFEALAKQLALPCSVKPTGALFTLHIGPASKGDRDRLKQKAAALGLPFSAALQK